MKHYMHDGIIMKIKLFDANYGNKGEEERKKAFFFFIICKEQKSNERKTSFILFYTKFVFSIFYVLSSISQEAKSFYTVPYYHPR